MKQEDKKRTSITKDSNRFGVCAKCKKRTMQLNAWYDKYRISEWVCFDCLSDKP